MSSTIWDEVGRRVDQSLPPGSPPPRTPTALVLQIIAAQPRSALAPGRTVLDPACADGQFLVAAKWVKVLVHGMSEQDAVAELYGVAQSRRDAETTRARLGGGTVLLGSALNPGQRFPGQTSAERVALQALLDSPGGPIDRS